MNRHIITSGDFTLFHLICISELPTALAEPSAGPILAYAGFVHPRHLASIPIDVPSKETSLLGILKDLWCSLFLEIKQNLVSVAQWVLYYVQVHGC